MWEKYFEEKKSQRRVSKEIEAVLHRMGKDRAIRSNEVPVEVWKVLGRIGMQSLVKPFNKMAEGDSNPSEWLKSYLMRLDSEVQEKKYRAAHNLYAVFIGL